MTKKWDRYRPCIISLYKEQNKPLHEVKRLMEDHYGFAASTRAYRTRLDKWKVTKYNCQRRRSSVSTQWSTESTVSSPRMIAPTHILGSESSGSLFQESPKLNASCRPAVIDELTLPELVRVEKQVVFELPVRPGPSPYPLCAPEANPLPSPIDPAYMSFYSTPFMFGQETAHHRHGQYSESQDVIDFKGIFMKREHD